MLIWIIALVALVIIGTGFTLTRLSGRAAESTGISLSGITILHSDTGGGKELAEPLRSETHRLVGKPDYILETKDGIIPVEVKPTRQANQPYESDLMQLAAYCLLLEETTGTRPPYGLLRYAQVSFRVEWSDELKAQLLAVLAEMRDLAHHTPIKGQAMPTPQHDMTARCTHCGFHYLCWED